MGIQGLLPFLKKATREVNIKNFSGCTVAVDAYCWLHRGAFSCAEKLGKGETTDGHVQFCIKMVNSLLAANVRPILVFDGRNLPSKSVTDLKRRESKLKNKSLAKQHLLQGNLREARECFQRCVEITSQMALQAIQACRKLGVDCLVAPYEADAQLAYLNKTGIAQIVITEDSDLVLFGCNQILYKIDVNGNGILLEADKIRLCLGIQASKFTFDRFRHMCIMSGCDYLPSLPGIGLRKSCKFFAMITNPDLNTVLAKIPTYLKMPNVNVTAEYKTGFIQANRTFLYQLVFDPLLRKLVPLNPYPADLNPNELHYAGTRIPDDVAYQLALGNIDLNTMQKVDNFDPDNNTIAIKTSSWSSKSTKSIWSINYEVKSTKDKVEATGFSSLRTVGQVTKAMPKSSVSNRKRSMSEPKSEDTEMSENEILLQYGSTKKTKIGSCSEPATAQKQSPFFSRYFETPRIPMKPTPDCCTVTPDNKLRTRLNRSSLSSPEGSSPEVNEPESASSPERNINIESTSDLSEGNEEDKGDQIKPDAAATPRGSLFFDRAITSKQAQTSSVCLATKSPRVGNFGANWKSLDDKLIGPKTWPSTGSMFARSPSNHTTFKSVIARSTSKENAEILENSSLSSSETYLWPQTKSSCCSFDSFTDTVDGFSPQCSQSDCELVGSPLESQKIGFENLKIEVSTPNVLRPSNVIKTVDARSRCRTIGLPRKKQDNSDAKQRNLKEMFAKFAYQKQRPCSLSSPSSN